jgi:hypothetical protein
VNKNDAKPGEQKPAAHSEAQMTSQPKQQKDVQQLAKKLDDGRQKDLHVGDFFLYGMYRSNNLGGEHSVEKKSLKIQSED